MSERALVKSYEYTKDLIKLTYHFLNPNSNLVTKIKKKNALIKKFLALI